VLVLDAHNTTAPASSELFVLVILHVERLGQGLEVLEVLTTYLSKGDTSCGLLVDKLAEVSSSADEAEWHARLAAEGW